MEFRTTSSPFVADRTHVSRIMRQVLYALVPGTLATAWYFGPGVLISIVLCVAFALLLEGIMLRLRGRPLKPFLTDYSAVVTAWLLALCLPPLMPWWMLLIGVFFAIVVAKQLYGGLGYNPFNPAMIGYVVLLVSFPREVSQWLPPAPLAEHPLGLMDSLRVILSGSLPPELTWDAVTMATPLDVMKTGLRMDQTVSEIRNNPLFGDFGGVGWEWIRNWLALGGLWLAFRRVIDWRIPLGVFLGMGVVATPFYLLNPDAFASPAFHVFSGGMILGAFFIATDPVTASTTPLGRLIYGMGIGILAWVIRTWGNYPDGIAFAVLLMNLAAPTIDYYTRPRVFGAGSQRKGDS